MTNEKAPQTWDERRRLAQKDSKKQTKRGSIPSDYMHEDELPKDMPQSDYDDWYAQSLVPDEIGCRIGPRYPNAADDKYARDKRTAFGIAYRYLHDTDASGRLQVEIQSALATVRAEEREAALKEAIEIAKRHWVLVPAESENRPLDVQRWQGYNLAAKEIRAGLEAALNRKGRGMKWTKGFGCDGWFA